MDSFLGYEIFIFYFSNAYTSLASPTELDKLSLKTVSSNFHWGEGEINGLNFNHWKRGGLFHSIWKSIILRSPAVNNNWLIKCSRIAKLDEKDEQIIVVINKMFRLRCAWRGGSF